MNNHDNSGSGYIGEEIISDSTYNLLAVLLSKLEGLEAYNTYLEDADDNSRQLLQRIQADDERHALALRQQIEDLVKRGGFR